MAALLQLQLDKILIFTLVLTRMSGLVLSAPVFGTRDVPLNVRALFAFAMAALVAPTQWHLPLEEPAGTLHFLIFVGAELLIGLTLGLGITILFSGLQVAGTMIGRVGGLALSNVFDPTLRGEVSLHSQLLNYVTLAVFVAIGGHRMLVAATLDTFSALPPGSGLIPVGLGEMATELVAQSFALGLRASAPIVTALLLSTLVLGIISRTLPQLNILAVGFGLNSMMTMLTMAVTIAAIAYLFQNQVEHVLDMMGAAIAGATQRVASGLGP
ncbi:MAG: type III secretion protein [Planctomycetota bacterium]|nr:MAG: type III secretion protein [Planctomycetota bacterium]REJ94373.1 MAG: type III secretion protein [Planctomycetota bacterium]REK22094.1 MAG: type III secretion protein [Planctomycetota bacterium]REK44502.1 MAG: type III secretion protein [Planctomycetota bacterium]